MSRLQHKCSNKYLVYSFIEMKWDFQALENLMRVIWIWWFSIYLERLLAISSLEEAPYSRITGNTWFSRSPGVFSSESCSLLIQPSLRFSSIGVRATTFQAGTLKIELWSLLLRSLLLRLSRHIAVTQCDLYWVGCIMKAGRSLRKMLYKR